MGEETYPRPCAHASHHIRRSPLSGLGKSVRIEKNQRKNDKKEGGGAKGKPRTSGTLHFSLSLSFCVGLKRFYLFNCTFVEARGGFWMDEGCQARFKAKQPHHSRASLSDAKGGAQWECGEGVLEGSGKARVQRLSTFFPPAPHATPCDDQSGDTTLTDLTCCTAYRMYHIFESFFCVDPNPNANSKFHHLSKNVLGLSIGGRERTRPSTDASL
jgi:hypothetical protein